MIPSTVRKIFFDTLSQTEDNIADFVNNPGVKLVLEKMVY